MGDTASLPAPASRHALALLRFPDPRTDWVVVTVATLTSPVDDLAGRLEALRSQGRLRAQGMRWSTAAAGFLELLARWERTR